MSLPGFVSFFITVGDDAKYLRHIGTSLSYEDEAGAVDPNTRFAVEKADSGGGLVHLRHCFTNRYLARGVDVTSYIKAEAVEKVEDETKAGCTLFRPQIKNGNTISLMHIQSGKSVCVKHLTSPVKRSYWVLAGESGSVPLETQYFNLESLLILPKRVIFKGDNGKYLGCSKSTASDLPSLLFNIDDDADMKAQFEVVQHKTGYTTIKSLFNDLFWNTSERGLIFVRDVDNDTPNNWLMPVNGPNGSICLRGVYGSVADKFCERVADLDGYKDILVCRAQSLMPSARLQLQEPVVSRMVWMDFRLDNSRIFNVKPLSTVTGTHRNESDTGDQTIELEASYTKTATRTWNNTVRTMLGIKTTFSAKFPFIVDSEIETTVELEYQREWGESVSTEESVSNKIIITVPPRHMAIATVFSTEGQCDVPFSYRQRDQLLSGEVVETTLHDGVYSNVNNYNFHSIGRVVPIDSLEDLGVPNSKDSPFQFSRDEYESLVEIYESKVAEARAAGTLDKLESTPTIIYGSLKKEKSNNGKLKSCHTPNEQKHTACKKNP